ncbi:succinylglutamate desuccinylase/aspartoacylase family protein [Labrenzia sp. DG1229]|uniref:succinylglutamate desuccinylase/aspartoacylase domain-containing protein n=1 Tax=Labrenzia sp. DG1229 TaxID=681847 RepID=UPI00048D4E73|nr:succinylglutamate desuccinylase/aspartoacylase family protein [Labrenzia sp. DG1229]
MLTTSLDLDKDGIQKGYIDVPVSLDLSAWSNQRVPIYSFKNGQGPSLLLLGGAHGDEFEAPVVLSNFANGGIDAAKIRGQVIIVPALNLPAVMNGSRLSPLDGGNMNRAFPGNPRGSPTERIADFVSCELISRADVVLDLHSGGRSLNFVPSTIVPMQNTESATGEIRALAAAFDAPLTVILREPQVETMIDTEVERQGKRILATELGGSGTISQETLFVTRKGIDGVMRHMGLMAGLDSCDTTECSRTVLVDGFHHYVYADDAGIFEPLAGLGDHVLEGDAIGRLHLVDRTGTAPAAVKARTTGFLFCTAGQGLVRRGDCISVIGHPVD